MDLKSTRIGIFNPCGTGNLGDEATVAALIQNLKKLLPRLDICCFSTNPADTRERHGVNAFPVRLILKSSLANELRNASGPAPNSGRPPGLLDRIKALLKSMPLLFTAAKLLWKSWRTLVRPFLELSFWIYCFKRLKNLDYFIIAGSGQLSDHFGGVMGYPYMIFTWSLIAKANYARLVFLSVGAGPLSSPLSRFLIKTCLHWSDFRSFRDGASKKLVERLGVNGNNLVFPDLAHSLQIELPAGVSSQLCLGRPRVGINPFPHYDPRYWPIGDRSKYQDYILRLSSFVRWLLDNDYPIILFPTQLRADPRVIQDLKKSLKDNGAADVIDKIAEPNIHTLEDLFVQLSKMDIVVATRFHGILFSFLMNKPVLGISNHHKMAEIMIAMGQQEYLLDINSFDLGAITQRFLAIEANREAIQSQIEEKIEVFRNSLKEQYLALLSLLG